MDDKNSNNHEKPWFGPKRFGYGNRATSWQGKLVVGAFVLLEVVIATLAPHFYPSWFKAKTSGTGFVPANWEGWLVVAGPGLLLLAIVGSIISRQHRK